MQTRTAVLLLSLGSLAAAPAAQSSVYTPAHFQNTEGPSYAFSGIGTASTPSVLLSVLDELQGTPRQIRAVSFRRDGQSNWSQWPASTMLVNIYASTAQTTSSTVDATLANNHGTPKTTVATFSLVQFAATSSTGLLEPFGYRFPFPQPYSFNGAGPLCLEIQVQSRNSTQYLYLDYVSYSNSNPAPITLQTGTGCKTTGSTNAANLSGYGSGNWPGKAVTLNYSGYYLPANGVVSALLGGSNSTVGGLPLPIELPGTRSAPSGACTLYNDILVQIPALTDPSGNLTLNLGLPVIPYFNGLSIFCQIVAPDQTANGWHFVLTNQVEHHITAPYTTIKSGIVYADGSVGPTGTVLASQGYVMKLDT